MNQVVRRFKSKSGFTLIEVIAVLVIMGIIAIVAVVRMNSTAEIDMASQVEVVKAHLRQAQTRAMSSGNSWGIFFHNNKKRYYLFSGAANTTPVHLLGENELIVDLQDKKSELRIDAPVGNTVTFNAYGSPGNVTIQLSTNCTNCPNNGQITITKNTGFIP